MGYTSKVTLIEDDLVITSYGNGAAYEVRDDAGGSFYTQGDEASRFRALYYNFAPCRMYPTFKDKLLAWGYEFTPEEEVAR